MKLFIDQCRFYVNYHQKSATLYSHLIGVPLILFSLMILLGFVHVTIPQVVDITLAGVATVALLIYYFILNWRLTLALAPFLLGLLWLSERITAAGPNKFSLWFFIITFILGWVFQLVGHLIEGKRPAFVDNLGQSLIAPLFLTAELFFIANRMQSLKKEIYEPSVIISNDLN